MSLNIVQSQTVVLMRDNMMYPKNEEGFFKCLERLDENPNNVDKVLKHKFKLYFSLTHYYEQNKDEIDEVIKLIL